MRVRTVLVSLVAAGSLLGLAGPAQAAPPSGQVVVFFNDHRPLEIFEHFGPCEHPGEGAQVLSNLTDKVVKVYDNPGCIAEGHGRVLEVRPRFGVDVKNFHYWSFSVVS